MRPPHPLEYRRQNTEYRRLKAFISAFIFWQGVISGIFIGLLTNFEESLWRMKVFMWNPMCG